MTEWTVEGIPHDRVNSVWNDVEPLLQSAVDRSRGEDTTDDLRFQILKRDIQLWVARKDGKIVGAGTTQITQAQRLRFCVFRYGGGSHLKFYKWGIHIIEAWARSQGCEEMRVVGRRGWVRYLEDFDEVYTVAAKRL